MLMISCYSKRESSFYPRIEYLDYEIVPRNNEELKEVKNLLIQKIGDKYLELIDIKMV